MMLNLIFKLLRAAVICVVILPGAGSLMAQGNAATKPAAVAMFRGAAISEEELQKAAAADLEVLELQHQQANANYVHTRHQILETNLARLIENKVIEAEAAKRGITKEALLAKELEGKVKEPSPQDVNAFYEANKQRINQPKEQVNGQIVQYLKTENYNHAKSEFVERLKGNYEVSVALEPLRMKVETAGNPTLGPETAPVTLVEFSDFQCPFCSRFSTTLQEVLAKYGKEVRLVYRQFPLSQIHPFAEKAAEASLCASDQGHFWEMHDLMFQGQNQLKEEDLKAKAAKLQLDAEAFNKCLDSGKYAGKVKQDQYEGLRLGVGGTPALFINGRFLSGALPVQDVAKIIDEEIQKKAPQTARAAATSTGGALPSSSAGGQ